MDRRLILTALACWPAAALRAQEDAPRPRHKIPASQLYEALSARFPVQLGVPGLFAVQLGAPRLLLRPVGNQLGAMLVAEVSGAQVPRLPAGEMDLVFGLRYEPADQTVRARDPQLLDLRWPGLAPETLPAVQSMLPSLSRNLGEIVLHRFTSRELALPETMGFAPERLQVVDDGLVIWFGPKPRP